MHRVITKFFCTFFQRLQKCIHSIAKMHTELYLILPLLSEWELDLMSPLRVDLDTHPLCVLNDTIIVYFQYKFKSTCY